MTIAQAAAKVLQKSKSPMSAQEVYEAIKKSDLYQFKTKDPRAVVSSTLRKYSSDTKNSLFLKTGNNKFRLR